ncbi:MAG TPA: hypothetical protein VHN20_05080 [Beijerinckiaceae bacterium]|nr:hypothetical protein [Beijerinckiaceae bacterium]
MQHTKFSKRSSGLILAGLCAAVIAWPATAHPEHKTETLERKVIIHSDGKGEASATWDGKDVQTKCPGIVTSVEAAAATSADKKQQAKIVLCTKGGTKAEQIDGLKRALARIQSSTDMDSGLKAQVIAELQARIAELGG